MEQPDLFGNTATTFNGVPTEQIEALFDFWKTTFHKRSTTILDDARKKKIATAIKAYGLDTCKHAVLGCSMSDWHTGKNPGNKQYTDLTLIFRNSDKVEAFLAIYDAETKGQNEMEEWINS